MLGDADLGNEFVRLEAGFEEPGEEVGSFDDPFTVGPFGHDGTTSGEQDRRVIGCGIGVRE